MSIANQGRPLRCLMMGYNGTGNTGSDIRLLTAIDDVRQAFGPDTQITVTTIDRQRTNAMLPANSGIEVVEFSFAPHRFMPFMWRLAKRHDVTLLVEGSTFKQNWSPWLLQAYVWTAFCTRWHRKHCIAYAVDVGELAGLQAIWTRNEINRMALVITRTEIARQRLIELGVTRPVIATTDTAFRFVQEPKRQQSARRVVGIAPIEFFHWPVRFKLWCRPEERFRWPFAFSWDAERRALSEAMVERFVQLARHALQQHDVDLQLIAMEDLDTPVCRKILERLGDAAHSRVSLMLSEHIRPADMVANLRGLDALVTSRYHACVLSMAGAVPQMAISHDERLKSIYTEMGLDQDYLLDYRQPDLGEQLPKVFDALMGHSLELSELIQRKHETDFVLRCAQNPRELRDWGAKHFDVVATSD